RPRIDVFDYRILLQRVEVRRPEDYAPDVGLAVARERCEDLGRAPASFDQLLNVATLQAGDQSPINRAAQFGDRGLVDARPGVNVILHIRREAHLMISVGFGQSREAAAVEIDPVVMDEVRVFARIHAAGLEPYLALLLVHFLDAAHDPIAFRDLILHLASHAVVKIEMAPSVALRHPDDLPAVGQIVAVLLSRIAEEGLRLFADDGARLAGAGVNLDHAIDLMPA